MAAKKTAARNLQSIGPFSQELFMLYGKLDGSNRNRDTTVDSSAGSRGHVLARNRDEKNYGDRYKSDSEAIQRLYKSDAKAAQRRYKGDTKRYNGAPLLTDLHKAGLTGGVK